MYILGLHFGHDASVSIIKDGEIVVCLECERRTRLRHAIGLTIDDIISAVKTANCKLTDISFCSVTSTQNVEYIFENPDRLSFVFDYEKINNLSWTDEEKYSWIENNQHRLVLSLLEEGIDHPYVRRLSTELKKSDPKTSIGDIEDYFTTLNWKKGCNLNQIDDLVQNNPLDDKMCNVMQLPVLVNLDGTKIPGWMMSHHFAHAAYAFYTSNYDCATIITQDGSLPRGGYWNGMCYYGKGSNLYPITPHYLSIGRLYESVSTVLGFGREEGPGKMMGLAPYGNPVFFDRIFVGNVKDIEIIPENDTNEFFPNIKHDKFDHSFNKWISHCANKAKQLNYDVSFLGNTQEIMKPINVDLASSTQLLLEETLLATVDKVYETFQSKGLKSSNNLCLSGGTALNCPANSRIYNEGKYKNIFVPPAVHDGGLSTGSALSIYYNLLKNERIKIYGNKTSLAYLGLKHEESSIKNNLEMFSKKFNYTFQKNANKVIAEKLAENKIVACCRGRSEVGPRALGHRSILANPLYSENWQNVNNIKKREQWRPFAPAVIQSKVHECFGEVPEKSPFMLFTAKVLKSTIPAVTHVDGSSRIQTVDKNASDLYEILTEFESLTGVPVILNTSFNGPGEPIIEYYDEAINFFSKSNLDYLYIENYQIKKIQKKVLK